MKKAVKTRIFSLVAVLVILVTSLCISPFSVASEESSPMVYVSPEGDDTTGDGTSEAPFYSLAKAYTTLKQYGQGTVVIMGDIQPEEPEAWNKARSAWGSTKQTGLLTLTGKDPVTGEIYEDATLRYNSTGLLGATKIEHLKLAPSRTSCFINSCGHPFELGEGVVRSGNDIVVHDGVGEWKKGTVNGTNFVLNGASIAHVFVGGGYPTATTQGLLGDAHFTVNSGNMTNIIIGFDKYNTTHKTGRIDGNVFITINGGTVGSITNSRLNDNKVGGFISVVFNNSIVCSYTLPDAEKGAYVIRANSHGKVESTDEAGVYKIQTDVGYSAYIGDEKIEGETVSVSPGETFIKFLRDGIVEIEDIEYPYIEGYSDGTFRPDEPLSRAEAVSLIVNATTSKELVKRQNEVDFDDIYKSDWYYDNVAYLSHIKALPLLWTESFLPNEDITRAEIVYILDSLIVNNPESSKLIDFTDVTKDNPYYNSILNASKNGFITGYQNGTFRPDYPLTRAEAVTVINRFIERTPVDGVVSEFSDAKEHWARDHIAAATSDFSEGKWEKKSSESFVMPKEGIGAEHYIKALYAQASHLSGEAIREGVDVIAEQMKKDILYTDNTDVSGITGKIYYVSEKNGKDTNNGIDAPIKTLSALSKLSLASGDAVLFERGGIYRGRIASKHGITYGSYGTGDKPLLMQSRKNYADKSLWQETEWENVYVCKDLLFNVGIIGYDHDLYDYSDASYSELYGDIMNINTLGFTGPQDLSKDLQFYSVCTTNNGKDLLANEDKLYVYSTEGNPGARFSSIEIGEKRDIFDGNPSNVTIDNIAMKFTGAHAIGYGDCKNITVTNCVFSWLGGSVLKINDNLSAVNYGNAVEIYGSCNGYYVKNNWMYQIYDTGVTHQRSASTGNCIQTDIEYNSNLIEYVHWGIEFYNAPPTKEQLGGKEDKYTRYTSNVRDYYNVCRMGGYGWGSVTRYRTTSARLYCGSTLSENFDQYTRYNIFDRCAGYLINLPANSTEVDDCNIYIQTLGCTLGSLKGTYKICMYTAHEDIETYLGDKNAVVVVVERTAE